MTEKEQTMLNTYSSDTKWKEAKKILERMNYDEDYAYSYEFEAVGIIAEAFDEINKENTNIKKQLDKANDRVYELERCIKHLQGSNRNKQNRIKNLESKLEELKKCFVYGIDIGSCKDNTGLVSTQQKKEKIDEIK